MHEKHQPLTAEIRDLDKLQKDMELIDSNPLAAAILNGVPVEILILNTLNQMVYANKAFITKFGITDIKPYLGLQPGKLMNCCGQSHKGEQCGSTERCRVCGALRSIRIAIEDGTSNSESVLNTAAGILNLQVNTSKIHISNREFVLFCLQDISNDKKRVLLERIFYHDILNTAHNISGMAELLSTGEFEESRDEFLSLLINSSNRLIEEINLHRLISTEQFIEQDTPPESINSTSFVMEMAGEFKAYTSLSVSLLVDKKSEEFDFVSHRTILKRVVTNMIKNAFEAESGPAVVCLGIYRGVRGNAVIKVHNPTPMNPAVQLQIFNRSFSTKGSDRGLGTYSMKILTEKYLNGKVFFISSPNSGTTFVVETQETD
jgi:signal transduction histidine kinase